MILVIMVRDFESFPEFRFVEQEIDDSIKLQMLYAELNRLERTIEIHGNPYIFVDDEEIRFSPDAGVERFEGHRGWLKEILCDDTLADEDSKGKLDTLRAVLDRLSSKETHPYILLILAQIVVISGVSTLCNSP